jgi:hypothetical protein
MGNMINVLTWMVGGISVVAVVLSTFLLFQVYRKDGEE